MSALYQPSLCARLILHLMLAGERGCGALSGFAGQALAAHLAVTGLAHVAECHGKSSGPALHSTVPCFRVQDFT